MAAEAVGVGDDVARAFAAAGAVGRLGHLGDHGVDVVAVDVLVRHVVAAAALGQVLFGAVALDLRAHGDAVVLDNENGRHFKKAGHVQALR